MVAYLQVLEGLKGENLHDGLQCCPRWMDKLCFSTKVLKHCQQLGVKTLGKISNGNFPFTIHGICLNVCAALTVTPFPKGLNTYANFISHIHDHASYNIE